MAELDGTAYGPCLAYRKLGFAAADGPYVKGDGKVVTVNAKGKGKGIQASKCNDGCSSSPNGGWATDKWFTCTFVCIP